MKEVKKANAFDSFEIIDLEEKLEFCGIGCDGACHTDVGCGCTNGACVPVDAGCSCNAGCGCQALCGGAGCTE